VEPGYLSSIARHLEDPGVGLVSNIIRGAGNRSLGATLENLHLNSFILGSVCFLDRFLGMPCVIGKSMLMRKKDLEAIGGLTAVKDFLAEDYIIGERMHRHGRKVVLSSHAINNVNEYWSVRRFIGRHVRWGRLRWRIGGIRYFSELLSNAVFMSALPVIALPLTKLTLLFAAAVCIAKIACDILIGRRLRSDMHPLRYLLSPAKDLIIGLAWFVPIVSNTVVWRGNRYIIGKHSLLSPCPAGKRMRVSSAVAAIKTRLAWAKA
jgi:ceramide glucosyltransferase